MKFRFLAAISGLVVAAACAGRAPEPTPLPRKAASAPAAAENEPVSLRAAELAEIPSVTFGPYVGVRPDGALVVWASVTAGKRRFNVVPLSAEGRPRGEPLAIADAPEEIGLVQARPYGSGYLVLYTERKTNDETLRALCLGADGKPLAEASTLSTLSGQGLWADAIATDAGILVVSASRAGRGQNSAEISAIALANGCRGQAPVTIAKDALAWQAAPLGQGALVAMVRASSGATPGFGTVDAVVLDGDGKERARLPLTREPTAELDLDAIAFGERALIAFSDKRGLEPRVVTALVDAKGALVAPVAPLTPADGEQTLVRLVPGAAPATGFVAWENLRGAGSTTRKLELSALDASGKLAGHRAELEYVSDDGGVPELVASQRGLSALTLAPACPRSGECTSRTGTPFYVEFDPALNPIAAEPLRLEPLDGRRAELGFGLGCTSKRCFALAALARAPAPVFATELEARSNAWRVPARRIDTSTRPRVVQDHALTQADTVADFSVAAMNGATYLSHITDFDSSIPWKPLLKPAPDGRFEPLRATITLERPASGLDKPAPVPSSPISMRADSLGGVSLAKGNADASKLLLAWAGLDRAEPQVFLTLVDKEGKKEAQRMFTRKQGAMGDIAVAWVDDGWVVAWVDARAGNPSLFAAKANFHLNRVTREFQLTPPQSSASEVALTFAAGTLYAVYADARGNDALGRAEIYARKLDPRDASPLADELRLSNTREHSFSPAVSASEDGSFGVAWLEQAPSEGGNAAVAGRRLVKDVPSELSTTRIAEGEPRALGLACEKQTCRLALTLELEAEREAALGVSTFTPAGIGDVVRVLDLDGARGLSVAPKVVGDSLLFVSASNEKATVRKALVAW